MMFAVSLVAFLIIQFPPGDFLTRSTASYAEQGGSIDNGSAGRR